MPGLPWCTWRVGFRELPVYLAGGFLVKVVYLAGGFSRDFLGVVPLFLGLRPPTPSFLRRGKSPAPNILLQIYCKQRGAALKKREIRRKTEREKCNLLRGVECPGAAAAGAREVGEPRRRPFPISEYLPPVSGRPCSTQGAQRGTGVRSGCGRSARRSASRLVPTGRPL